MLNFWLKINVETMAVDVDYCLATRVVESLLDMRLRE